MNLEVDIFKDYGSFVLDVAFSHDDGVLGLLGASGCGKSMTMKCIAGIIKPDKGRIVLNGKTLFDATKRINLKPQERNIGYLFQSYVLFPNMTTLENIRSGMGRVPENEKSNLLHKVIDMFLLNDYVNHYPSQLSGGQKQRVALARMLASKPQMIMLDEPLSALDSYLKHQVEEDMLDLFEYYTGSALYVSHNRDEINRYCDDVCVMEAGKIVEKTTKKDLFQNPIHLSTAKLSGCKNYSRIKPVKESKTEVQALDWGVTLKTGKGLSEEMDYIGVRSHYLQLSAVEKENSFPVDITRVVDNLFEIAVFCRPKNHKKDSSENVLRLDMTVEEWRLHKDTEHLYCVVPAKELMLLKK